MIRCKAALQKPAKNGRPVTWTFCRLPKQASAKLPSRGQVTVKGSINDAGFTATLEPDGEGGHWLKVTRKLREAAEANVGDAIALQFAPVPPEEEPEPSVPADLRKALASDFPGSAKAREVWKDITPVARRDWIAWIVSAKQAATRERRINNACDMLSKGKRRPCCFDRSGMYSKSITCPAAEPS